MPIRKNFLQGKGFNDSPPHTHEGISKDVFCNPQELIERCYNAFSDGCENVEPEYVPSPWLKTYWTSNEEGLLVARSALKPIQEGLEGKITLVPVHTAPKDVARWSALLNERELSVAMPQYKLGEAMISVSPEFQRKALHISFSFDVEENANYDSLRSIQHFTEEMYLTLSLS